MGGVTDLVGPGVVEKVVDLSRVCALLHLEDSGGNFGVFVKVLPLFRSCGDEKWTTVDDELRLFPKYL